MRTLVKVTNELNGKEIGKSIVSESIEESRNATILKYGDTIKLSDFGSLLLTNLQGTFRFTFTQTK
jgi:hypothetical protein